MAPSWASKLSHVSLPRLLKRVVSVTAGKQSFQHSSLIVASRKKDAPVRQASGCSTGPIHRHRRALHPSAMPCVQHVHIVLHYTLRAMQGLNACQGNPATKDVEHVWDRSVESQERSDVLRVDNEGKLHTPGTRHFCVFPYSTPSFEQAAWLCVGSVGGCCLTSAPNTTTPQMDALPGLLGDWVACLCLPPIFEDQQTQR
mmetsp:Transcript_101523/g.176224  ORF Transcript_101523/g.176224 Transcript_101523/m.176224 type:complete len:200 (+) Transcript_101523:872-1471(+)